MLLLIGTYTRNGGEGIHRVRLVPETGALHHDGVAARLPDPSFLALHPRGHTLYAVSELAGEGSVSAFQLDRGSGSLRLLGTQPSGGGAPCHLSAHPSGRVLLVANYESGTAAALPIHHDGSLAPPSSLVRHEGIGPHPERQDGPHAHCAIPSPDGRFAFVVDLGTDRVSGHRIDPERAELVEEPHGGLTAPAGSGPRHLLFASDGRSAFLIAELSNRLTALDYAAERGVFTPVCEASLLPPGERVENTAAAVHLGPGGVVYASNRGHDSLVAMRRSGRALEVLGHARSGGRGPRDFAVDPSGRWVVVANEGSGDLVTLAIEPETGRLSDPVHRLALAAPVCALFL